MITVVIPSRIPAWQNAIGFLNDPVFKPALYDEYDIVILPDGDNCYMQGLKLGITILASFSAAILQVF